MSSASNNLMMNAADCCCTNMYKQKNVAVVHWYLQKQQNRLSEYNYEVIQKVHKILQ